MRTSRVLATWVAAVLLGGAALAQKTGGAAKALDEAFRERLEQTIARKDVATADWVQLLTDVLAKEGESEALLQALEAIEAAPDAADERKFEARRALTFLLHREGRLVDALKRCDEAITVHSTPELLLQRAHLLDAQNKIDDALAAYAAVQKVTTEAAVLDHIGLRTALLEFEKAGAAAKVAGGTGASSSGTAAVVVSGAPLAVASTSGAVSVAGTAAVPAAPAVVTSTGTSAVAAGGTSISTTTAAPAARIRVAGSAPGAPGAPSAAEAADGAAPATPEDEPSALYRYATEPGRDAELQNRAAVVLAIVGRPREAIRLYQVSGEGSDRFRQEVRLAEWAIVAKQWKEAQEHAWNARVAAVTKRDRHYALTVLVEAHRADKSLVALTERFAAEPTLDQESRRTWIDLLRETARVDEATRLFVASGEGGFTPEMRSELIEMFREAGREDELVATYQKLIEDEPERIEWRAGLSRYFLERGEREKGARVWETFVEGRTDVARLMAAANAARDLGLEELARSCADRAARDPQGVMHARLFLFDLEVRNGNLAGALEQLEAFDKEVDAKAPERIQLAEAFERVGNKKRAVDVLEGVRLQRGGDDAEEDLEMRLSWLLSEVGDEKRALERWQNLWKRVNSIPRRRQVEDRLMSVASRLGVLADIAVDIEQRLVDGQAEDREVGLLVRLYQKVGDPMAAAEVLEEHLKKKGSTDIEVLREKARVYLGGKDYYHFEKTVKTLIELDPDNKSDHLRQLAMSNLERGRPAEARAVLSKLAECESPGDAAEFEAGVLALAGLNEDAVKTYRRGLAQHPERIDSYLLLANAMKALRQTERAIGMFQQIAETAEKDDLFTIAIDGVLNMRAKEPVLRWARRVTLERIARRHDKMYLYQLYTDLSDELNDQQGQMRALETSLAIAAEQRAAILRQLMEVSLGKADTNSYVVVNGVLQPRRRGGEDPKRLAYGRRLIGLEDLVPPQVFLELGEAFLRGGEVANAAKTFSMARDVPDYASFRRQVARAFESAQYAENALDVYERAMASEALDPSLLLKAGELHEQLGRDERACELYTKAMNVLLAQHALSGGANSKKKEPENRWYAQNVGDFERYFPALQSGFLATASPERMQGYFEEQRQAFASDLEALDALPNPEGAERKAADSPRLLHRAAFLRFVGLRTDRIAEALAVDLELLKRFPKDDALLEQLCTERASRGYVDAAAKLVEASGLPEKSRERMLARLGRKSEGVRAGQLKLADVVSRLVPILIEGDQKKASLLLRSTQLGATSKDDLPYVQLVCSAALYVRDESSVNALTSYAIRATVEHSQDWQERQRIPTLLEKARKVISKEAYDVLVDSFVALVSDKDEKLQEYQYMLRELQTQCGRSLLTAEALKKRVEACVPDRAWMLDTLVGLAPAEQRLGLIQPVWSRIPESDRPDLALGLLAPENETVPAAFADFLVEAFDEAVDAIDDPRYLIYAVQNLAENEKVAPEIAQRVVDRVVKKWGDQGSFLCLQANILLKRGQVAEAFEKFHAGLVAGPKDENDWGYRNSVNGFVSACGREHALELLAAIDRYESEKSAKPDEAVEPGDEWNDPIFQARQAAFYALGDEEKKRELLEKKLAKKPDDVRALDGLYQDAAQRGDVPRQIELLERLVEADKKAPHRREWLVNVWMGQRNPVRALAVRKAGEEKKDESEKKGEGKKLDTASIEAVKKAVDDGKADVAQTTYRRTWRRYYQEGNRFGGIVYYGNWYGADARWPEKADEAAAKPKKAWRGGLDDYHLDETPEEIEQKAKAKAQKTAYDGIAEQAFGEDELARQVRLLDDQALQRSRAVLRGLQRAEVKRKGAEAALAGWKQKLAEGRASMIDRALMLSYFEDHQKELGASDRETLGELAVAVHPLDGAQLRALARLNSGIGATARSLSLYKWLATLASARRWFYGNENAISAHELIDEVAETLKGADAETAFEAILRTADPGESDYERDEYEALVISTWTKQLPAARAFERTKDLVLRVSDTQQGLRRMAALRAACLLAAVGDSDRALTALEAASTRLEPEKVKLDPRTARWQKNNLGPRQLGWDEVRALVPAKMGEGVDAAAWCQKLAARVLALDAKKALDPDTVRDVLIACCVRLHALGAKDRAAALIDEIDRRSAGYVRHELLVLDLARLFGREARAREIETKLIERKSLPYGRIPEIVERIAKEKGDAAAFEALEGFADRCLDPIVVDPLVALADKLGKPDRADAWKQQRDAAKTAATELKLPW